MIGSGPWLTNFAPQSERRLRVFCLAHSGASGFVFRDWAPRLAAEVEVWGVHLPGRAHRLSEPPFRNLGLAAKDIARAIEPFCTEPFALFGHSVGATLAFETSQELALSARANLRGLHLSGTSAPGFPRRRGPFHQLPDAELILELLTFDGTAAEIFKNEELMALTLPVIRADFEMAETWKSSPRSPVSCPLFCYGGSGDPDTWPSELESWRAHAGGAFHMRLYEGGHFYLFQNSVFLPELAVDLARGY